MPKHYLPTTVYDAAKARIREAILTFDDFYVSFSGGKDSGALLHLVLEVATELDRLPVKAVFSDLECVFQSTADFVQRMMDRPDVQGYWLCMDEIDENASSVYERYYRMWDRRCPEKWVRPMPTMPYVINAGNCPPLLRQRLHLDRMDQWSLTGFGEYLCDAGGLKTICNFIGMRTDETYGRHMAVAAAKHREKRNPWTYLTKDGNARTWTCLPIYDWSFGDVWKYHAVGGLDYNRVYDQYLRLGIPESEMRTCYAFGEEQKKSLWMWAHLEPDTWDRLVARVEGANFGKIYNHTNINRGIIRKPEGLTWKQYLDVLLDELPELTRENFLEKFEIVFRYHRTMYADKGIISMDAMCCDSRAESKTRAKRMGLSIKHFFSYETLCWAVIKRDFVFKRYGFGYSNKMVERISRMQQKWSTLL